MTKFCILSMCLAMSGRADYLQSYSLDANSPQEALAKWLAIHPPEEYRFLKLENVTDLHAYKDAGWNTRTI